MVPQKALAAFVVVGIVVDASFAVDVVVEPFVCASAVALEAVVDGQQGEAEVEALPGTVPDWKEAFRVQQ